MNERQKHQLRVAEFLNKIGRDAEEIHSRRLYELIKQNNPKPDLKELNEWVNRELKKPENDAEMEAILFIKIQAVARKLCALNGCSVILCKVHQIEADRLFSEADKRADVFRDARGLEFWESDKDG